jgi:hypothetical protein
METTIKRNRYLKLPAELYERLQAARGSRPWPDFIAELEVKLKLTRDRNPHKYYFEFHLKEMHLSENQVCILCKQYSMVPQKLNETVDYLQLALETAHQEGININEKEMQERFAQAGLVHRAHGCPRCHAYEGYLPFESLLDFVLPEHSIAILKGIYKSNLKM